jgi:hypothetical protein
MDKVQKTAFTGYNAPSSEPFRLRAIGCLLDNGSTCASLAVWSIIQFAYQNFSVGVIGGS